MAIDLTSGGSGSFSEGNAYSAIAELQRLRKALDAGQISVKEFIEQGKPISDFVFSEQQRIGGSGSKGADAANSLRRTFDNTDVGFKFTDSSDRNKWSEVNLPEKYQQDVRATQLPSNLTPEEREKALKEIPNDVPINSDRYLVEREGLRQEQQSTDFANQSSARRDQALNEISGNRDAVLSDADARRQALLTTLAQQRQGTENQANAIRSSNYDDIVNGQKTTLDQADARRTQAYNDISGDRAALQTDVEGRRSQALTELGQVLSKQSARDFDYAIPQVAESANVAGIYRSTGFGDALARERTRLEGDVLNKLALQGVNDRELNIGNLVSGREANNTLKAGNADAYANELVGNNKYANDVRVAGTADELNQLYADSEANNAQRANNVDQSIVGRYANNEARNAGISQNREQYETDLANVLGAKQGFQFDAISRDFTQKDYAAQVRDAMRIADLSRPRTPSGGKAGGSGFCKVLRLVQVRELHGWTRGHL
jgi:hypothetical protein